MTRSHVRHENYRRSLLCNDQRIGLSHGTFAGCSDGMTVCFLSNQLDGFFSFPFSESYQQLLFNQWNERFKEILAKNVLLMIVTLQWWWKTKQNLNFWYDNFLCKLQQQRSSLIDGDFRTNLIVYIQFPYPRSLPYRESMPKIFLEIKDFATVCAKFAEGFNVRSSGVSAIVWKELWNF